MKVLNLSPTIEGGRKALRDRLSLLVKALQKTGPSFYFTPEHLKAFSKLIQTLDGIEEQSRKIFYVHDEDHHHRLRSKAVRNDELTSGLVLEPPERILPPILSSNNYARRVVEGFLRFPTCLKKVKIVTGIKLTDCYRDEAGCSSCMTGEDQQPIVRFYAKFPKQIALATMTDLDYWGDTNVIERALLWTLDNGKQYLDSVYDENDTGSNLSNLSTYAYIHGILQYQYASKIDKDLVVTVATEDQEQLFPFMDTFKIGTVIGKKLRLGTYTNSKSHMIQLSMSCCDASLSPLMFRCPNCSGNYEISRSLDKKILGEMTEKKMCPNCIAKQSDDEEAHCLICGKKAVITGEGRCSDCRRYRFKCRICGETDSDRGELENNSDTFPVPYVCGHCSYRNGLEPCHCCGVFHKNEDMEEFYYDGDDKYLCKKCAPKFEEPAPKKKRASSR